jgi:hypothetical protein
MPGATAPFVGGWKFFVSRSSCSARFVWKRSTISITLRRLISLAMAAQIPLDSLGTVARFFSVFIVIPFIVGFLKTVYTGSRADLTIHISESWLVAWHIEETMRDPVLFLFCRRGLETELGDMRLDQVGKKQMREQR